MVLLAAGHEGRLKILCLGAHADDIEIGTGGTILGLIEAGVAVEVFWAVLSASNLRVSEATASAADFLAGAAMSRIEIGTFKDGFFPYQGHEIKSWFENLKNLVKPDVIFTHRRDDGHQDHREVCKLTWNTFRDHLILEYEIPKWDGDFGQPNIYMPLSAQVMARKVHLLLQHFGTQRSKDWFDGETFRGIARLRGMECRAPDNYAEGFILRKGRLEISLTRVTRPNGKTQRYER
jgi:LmbE family N-acetylglucosaminyl deacetylase